MDFPPFVKRAASTPDPYYIPRQNHLQGQQWMSKPRYYNLSAIINGWLEKYSCVLKESGEYVPTVRLLEYPQQLSELCTEVIRIELPASTFIISSEVIQAFPQILVRVRVPQVAPAPRLPYMSAWQPWLPPPRAYRLAYMPTYPPPELCRICQQVWTMGCPICPTCQVLQRYQ
ncbi:hypothetical protein HPB49_004357 [Dermacentor silvarum]|uniref:Uncharacterized protein n=1 Tax=Dermacentor silvarum TaxID=543639 RepID=A0ACB8DUR1_DERSI|nr:hypothetical protein HPB49_004357 [Dermacentor silvarum]